MKNIRNFTIIAHIDHGKSTLADRMLEITGSIEKRKMKEQVLDSMDLERERGITIKMQPTRMEYKSGAEDYILNLIDTPGHIDFSYEVSRALKAVEGSVLLVDATQGVQAQTLSVLAMARSAGLVIIPVVSKIDSPIARVSDVKEEISKLLSCGINDILEVSGKTGQGVALLLDEIVNKIPHPSSLSLDKDKNSHRALIFDFQYEAHRGVIVFVRVFDGEIKRGDQLTFVSAGEKFSALEVGIFNPEPKSTDGISSGEIGYIVTGIKKAGVVSVGDTITSIKNPLKGLPGYMQPRPVVWASIYPESQDDFPLLRQSLERLKLSDPAISFEEEASGALGRGFRCGFLGMLHLEIIMERLKREFNIDIIMTIPSVTYEIKKGNGKNEIIYNPSVFPTDTDNLKVFEPWVIAQIITPPDYIGGIMQKLFEHEAVIGDSEVFGDSRTSIKFEMPLRELMRGFFDELKSVSSGFASLSYEMEDMKEADVVRLDIFVAEEIVTAFSKVVSKKRVEKEALSSVERLYKILPRQMFVTKIQAVVGGRIISSRTLTAMKKDVTAKLYGGDITRKMKLREKQKKGKKKMRERGRVNIPQNVFLKMMKSGDE